MSETAGVETSTTYEVWREHRRGGPDVCVGRNMSEGGARHLLAECNDPVLADFATFYLVRATTTRERLRTEAPCPSPSRVGLSPPCMKEEK